MKKFLAIILACYFSLQSCGNKNVQIIIKNKSNKSIENFSVIVQGKAFEITQIESNTHSILSVPYSSLDLNSHEFIIQSKFKVKNEPPNTGFYYSDLSGMPNKEYIIEVYDSNTVIK